MFNNLLQIREQEAFQRLLKELPHRVRVVMTRMGIKHYQHQPMSFLIWFQWSRHFQVSFEYTVQTIVQGYRERCYKTGPILGLKLTMLTSNKTRLWFEQELRTNPPTTIQTPVHLLKQLHQVKTPEEYTAKVDELRRLRKIQPMTKTKAYRGSQQWKPRNPQPDAILREFGY